MTNYNDFLMLSGTVSVLDSFIEFIWKQIPPGYLKQF